jgi:hypothetical protein
VALRLDRADLIDLLGQRPTLAQQVFASVFAMLDEQAATT